MRARKQKYIFEVGFWKVLEDTYNPKEHDWISMAQQISVSMGSNARLLPNDTRESSACCTCSVGVLVNV